MVLDNLLELLELGATFTPEVMKLAGFSEQEIEMIFEEK